MEVRAGGQVKKEGRRWRDYGEKERSRDENTGGGGGGGKKGRERSSRWGKVEVRKEDRRWRDYEGK